jgi:lysozyme
VSNGSKKDAWDKFSAISSFMSAVVIAAIGLYFTNSYNRKQLAIQQASTLAQFLPSIGSSNPRVQQAAYQGLITLGYASLAAGYAANSASRAAFAVQSVTPGTSAQAAPHLQALAVRGIDVSIYNGTIDWHSVASNNVGFAAIRCTEGTNRPDDNFVTNSTEARRAGVKVGAYHMYDPRADAVSQARWYLAKADVKDQDFPPMLDIELAIPSGSSRIAGNIQRWLDVVQAATKRRPMLYVIPSIRERPDLLRLAAKYPVWIAQYGEASSTPFLTPWTVWQYSDQGHVNGINGPVDLNIFNGNENGLDAFLRNSRSPT